VPGRFWFATHVFKGKIYPFCFTSDYFIEQNILTPTSACRMDINSHPWAPSLAPVSASFTTEIAFFAECNTRQKNTRQIFYRQCVFCRVLFWHSAKTLPSIEKHSTKKSTRQIKNRKKNKKHFFKKLQEQLSNPTYYITHRSVIFRRVFYFIENFLCGTRQIVFLPSVRKKHSAKYLVLFGSDYLLFTFIG
jgi:hypothetical protein